MKLIRKAKSLTREYGLVQYGDGECQIIGTTITGRARPANYKGIVTALKAWNALKAKHGLEEVALKK